MGLAVWWATALLLGPLVTWPGPVGSDPSLDQCNDRLLELDAIAGSLSVTFSVRVRDRFKIFVYQHEGPFDCTNNDMRDASLLRETIITQGNVSLTESVEDCRATERVCCMANEKRCALCNREYNAVAGGYHYCAKMHSLEENLHTATVYVDVGGSPEPMEIVTGSGFTTTWWAFSSIIAGVTLAAIAVVCRYRSRSVRATSHEAPGPSTRVLLSKESPQLSGHISVFYHDDGAVHRDCVVRLADVLWHFLQRPVVVVDDRHRGTVAEIGMAEWISRTLDGTGNTVVFVASEGAYRQIRNHGNHVTEKVPLVGDGNANDAFLLAWRTIVCNQRLAQNYSRVFNVRFQYTNVTHLTPDIVQRRSFCLPRDFAELSFHLLGCNEEAQRRSNVIRQALTTSRSFAELADAIWRVTGAPDDEARWIRPGL